MFSFGHRRLRAKLAAIFNADPQASRRFVKDLGVAKSAATDFMNGDSNALTKQQTRAATAFAEAYGFDMATNRLVRPGFPPTAQPRVQSPGAGDGGVAWLDLWGFRAAMRDALRWHERPGAQNAPVTFIGKVRAPAEPYQERVPFGVPEPRETQPTASEALRARRLQAINPNWR